MGGRNPGTDPTVPVSERTRDSTCLNADSCNGTDRTTSTTEDIKFATYHHDATGLDYADQRYYDSRMGRFLTADSVYGEGVRENPASWNRYAYTTGDPINRYDPTGEKDYEVVAAGDLGGGGFISTKCKMLGFLPVPNPLCGILPSIIVAAWPPPTKDRDEEELRIPTTLLRRDDCYWANGTGYSASYTRASVNTQNRP